MRDGSEPPFIVFVTDSIHSHANSTMGLARRLQRMGMHVEYWGHSYVADAVAAQSFVFRDIKGMWPFYERFLPAGVWRSLWHPRALLSGFRSRRNRRRALPAALRRFQHSLGLLLNSRLPDLAIFHPFVLHYHAFFAQRGVACVSLLDKPLPLADPAVGPPDSGLLPSRTAFGRLWLRAAWLFFRYRALSRNARERFVGALGCYRPEQLLEAIGQCTGMPIVRHRLDRGLAYDVHFSNVPEWILNASECDLPRANVLPAHIRYVGQCADDARAEPLSPIARKSTARFFVYVSMGTAMGTWDKDFRLLEKIVQGLRGISGVQVALSTGNDRARAALAARFPNIDVFEYLPQLALLRAADLAITHAGWSTVRECILTGTPMLTFPREYDQPACSARVVHYGLGLRGYRMLDTSNAIRRKALRILLDPEFRRRVQQMRERLAANEPAQIRAALGAVLHAPQGSAMRQASPHELQELPERLMRHDVCGVQLHVQRRADPQ
jgi:zeaxanthin glucosyltransferase